MHRLDVPRASLEVPKPSLPLTDVDLEVDWEGSEAPFIRLTSLIKIFLGIFLFIIIFFY